MTPLLGGAVLNSPVVHEEYGLAAHVTMVLGFFAVGVAAGIVAARGGSSGARVAGVLFALVNGAGLLFFAAMFMFYQWGHK